MSDKKSVEMKRTVNAPVEKVWDAFTNPDTYKKWYGPQNVNIPSAEFDFREGGKFFVAMESGSYKFFTGGEYTEIVPNEKIAYTDHLVNENREQIEGPEFKVQILFKKLDENQTEVTVYYDDVSGIDENAVQGMQYGWTSSLEKLEKLFA